MTKALAALALVALAAPVRAVNVDPSADGPFAVGVTTLAFADAARGRSLITELWYPARAAGRAAPVRRGSEPDRPLPALCRSRRYARVR